jgi:Rrf2 family protein
MPAIPRQVEYALMALVDMHSAPAGQLFAVRELGERHHVPFDVLSKAMQRMARAGILSAVQGVNGGYRIARELGSVSLLEVLDAVSGEMHTVNCLKSDKSCPLETSCTVSSIMSDLDARLRHFYAGICISDLVDGRLHTICGDPTSATKSG